MDLSPPLTDRLGIATKFAHNLVWVMANNLLSKMFSPPLKNLAGKPRMYLVIEDRRQSEARNFETAQHIDK